MKVLSYNISWFKQEKIDWTLAHKDVDAFVLPECADKEITNIPKGYSFYWTGDFENKGLGVIVNNNHKHIIPSITKLSVTLYLSSLMMNIYCLQYGLQ